MQRRQDALEDDGLLLVAGSGQVAPDDDFSATDSSEDEFIVSQNPAQAQEATLQEPESESEPEPEPEPETRLPPRMGGAGHKLYVPTVGQVARLPATGPRPRPQGRGSPQTSPTSTHTTSPPGEGKKPRRRRNRKKHAGKEEEGGGGAKPVLDASKRPAPPKPAPSAAGQRGGGRGSGQGRGKAARQDPPVILKNTHRPAPPSSPLPVFLPAGITDAAPLPDPVKPRRYTSQREQQEAALFAPPPLSPFTFDEQPKSPFALSTPFSPVVGSPFPPSALPYGGAFSAPVGHIKPFIDPSRPHDPSRGPDLRPLALSAASAKEFVPPSRPYQ